MYQLRVRSLMVFLAIVAVNLALLSCFDRNVNANNSDRTGVLVGTVPIMIILNIGVFLSFGSRGRVRAFWIGFLLCGAMAMMATIWAVLTPPAWAGSLNPGPNPIQIREASLLWKFLDKYSTGVRDGLGIDLWPNGSTTMIRYIIFMGTLEFLTQSVVAFMGGLIFRFLVPAPSLNAVASEKREV